MQRKFLSNLILLLFLNLLIKSVWILGIDLKVQNVLGTEIYGDYYALLNFTFLLNIILDMGISNFNKVNIAQHPHLLKKHFNGIISLRILLALGYSAIVMITGFVSGFKGHEMYLLGILVFNQFLISLILYLRSNLAGLLQFRTDAIVSVIDRSLLIIFCLVLLNGYISDAPFSVDMFVYAQTASYGLTALIALALVLRQTRQLRFHINWPFWRLILKKSWPFALLILLMAFYNRVDAVLLERLLPNGDVMAGLYAQGYRLLDAVNMIGYLSAGLLLPIFAHQLKKRESVEELLSLAFRIFFAGSVLIGIVCFTYASDMLELMYVEQFEQGPLMFGLLMCCFIPISMIYVFGTLLTANQNLRALNIIAGTGMLLNIILNIVLIPRFEAAGAAAVSLSAQTVTALIQIILVQRIFQFKLNGKLMISLTLFIGLSIGSAFGITYLEAAWYYKAAATAGAIGLVSLLTGLVSLKKAITILRFSE